MTGVYTQDTRIGNFDTPLGENKLVLRRFDAVEGMSELFEFKVEAIAMEEITDFDRAIGKNCTVTLLTIGGGKRFFDGILTEVQLIDADDEGFVYRLILRPWLWLLSKTRNSLIFHEKTAPEIITQVFSQHKEFISFENQLSESYPKLEYCVQYRESDMDFVRRLMEQHGISFHFRHENGKHTLIMGDGTRAYEPVAGEKRPLISIAERHLRDTEHLFRWAPERKFTTGRVTLTEYDFKRPTANLESQRIGDAKYQIGGLEDYDYPGKYVDPADGDKYARRRLDGVRAADGRFHAAGDCASLSPGKLMTLSGHPQRSYNKKYLVLRCTHTFFSETYRSKSAIKAGGYEGRYEFMDAARSFAPECVTPKPYLRGPQTAVVVGNGEIDCDEFGRVMVQFPWDRKKDRSMRVRVAQVWASDKWGGIFIPRVGMEVIVDFLEGDPDCPIIIGCVYNGANKPPYDLPDEKNVAGWKSKSTPGSGYNEIAMDDSKGSELLRIHAQRDMESVIENDERRKVGKNDTLDVGNELFIEAGSKITLKVGMSTVVIDASSITLKSINITGQATGHLETKSNGTATHQSTAPMVIKAAIVNIN